MIAGIVASQVVDIGPPPDLAPVITSSNSVSVAENITLAHALTANESVTWSLVGGADQARFELSGSTLRWLSNGTKNFEVPDDADTNNTYIVTVRATDTALQTTDQTITATVTDADETAPTITSSNTASVAENATLAHALTADEAVTWSIIGGVDAAHFEISGSTLRFDSNGTKDFEVPDDDDTDNDYVVQVRATDTALNTADQTITVTVTDVAEGGPAPIYLGRIASGGTVNIGAADPDCLVVVAIEHCRSTANGRSISSVTIDGSAGTIHAQVGGNTNSGAGSGIASRVVTGGGTITISWAMSGATESEADVYTISGLVSTTPSDTATANGNDPTATIDLSDVGVVIGAAASGGSPTATMTWVGLDTRDSDDEGIIGRFSAANSANTTTAAGHPVSVSQSSANEVITVVAWA